MKPIPILKKKKKSETSSSIDISDINNKKEEIKKINNISNTKSHKTKSKLQSKNTLTKQENEKKDDKKEESEKSEDNEKKEEKSEKNKEESKEEIKEVETEKQIREKELSDLAQALMKKNLEGRAFIEAKIKKWSQAILDEMCNYFLERYPQYGFGILIFISEEKEFYTGGQAVFNRELDSKIVEKYENPNLSAVLVIFFIKKRKRNKELLLVDPEHFFNINRIFGDAFEERKFTERYETYMVNVVNDINTYIIKDYTLGKSFHQGFTLRNEQPRIHANFKFGNLEFLPYITSYSNDQAIAHLFIFFVNN